MAGGAHGVLLGRGREQQLLSGLVGGAREAHSGVLVVLGDAGIGKTALIEAMVTQATGFRVIRANGAQFELELPYAGLQQICAPLNDLMVRLPGPQSGALRVALGIEAGDGAPDQLLIGLALLTLLAEAGAQQPTVCVVDDAHWLDRTSLCALVFAARRLHADRVVVVLASREPVDILAGLPELVLSGLADADARILLAGLVPGRLSGRARDSIIAESAGNPLAILELHGALDPVQLAGGYGLAHAKSLSSRLEQTFLSEFRALPPQTCTLLLLAAAEPTGDATWLWAAAHQLGIGVDAAVPAEAAGLVKFSGRVLFRHPLVRSAIYGNSPLEERRRVHDALAHVMASPAFADHRAWHRANAAAAPDEMLAAELELAAKQAGARGGTAAAAAFLTLAMEITPELGQRASRAVSAARVALDAGALDSAERLLDLAAELTNDETVGAQVDHVRARWAFAARRGRDAPLLLLAAARRLAPISVRSARDTYLEAIMASLIVGRFCVGEPGWPATVAAQARQAPLPAGAPTAADLLLDGLIVRLTEGYVAGAPILQAAIKQYVREMELGIADPKWHDITNRVSLDLFDQDAYNTLTVQQLSMLRAAGALTMLPAALWTYAGLCVGTGHIESAGAAVQEAAAITAATGTPLQISLEPYFAAYRGQEKLCSDTAHATIDAATARGDGTEVTVSHYALAILHNALGNYAQAVEASLAGLADDDFGLVGYLLPELIEAATRCGEISTAASALSRLTERTSVSGTSTALGVAARSRALLSDGSAADDEYREAIHHLESSPVAVFLARAHLVYGEWLRRGSRRAEARTHLRTASDMFLRMGIDGFARRTRRELEAAGATVGPTSHGTSMDTLTLQEKHIARLARTGYTNSEIGAQLFISPRTVEWHLGRIFTKLGVTSRRELRTVPFTG